MSNSTDREKEIDGELAAEDQNLNSFDQILELAGSWGPWQKRMFVIISCSQIFSAIHAVAAVFLSATPSHICNIPGGHFANSSDVILESLNISSSLQNSTVSLFKNFPEQCDNNITSEMSNEFISDLFLNETEPVLLEKCTDWIYDTSIYKSTVVTEWSLVCSKRWMQATVQASYMGGVLIGSVVFGQVSDRLGRRTTMCLTAASETVIALGVAFVTNYWAFIALRFLLGGVCGGMMVSNFVLLMEITKPDARTQTGMWSGIFFGIGVSLMGLFAFFFRDWRNLQISIAIFTATQLLYFWLIPESPRWLVTKGRFQEALNELKKISKGNKKQLLDDEHMMELLQKSGSEEEREQRSQGVIAEQATLVRTPVMRRRSLIGFVMWCLSAMIYYGLIFTVEKGKGANPFLQIFIYGVAEIPGFILTVYALRIFGRRLTSCGLFMLCGLCLAILIVVPQEYRLVRIGMATTGKLFDTSVFQLCYLYTSELAPTDVRNIAVGTSSMFGRVGASAAPYIILLLEEIQKNLPTGFFAVASVIAGCLTLLLPETNSRPLPQTIEEVEQCKK